MTKDLPEQSPLPNTGTLFSQRPNRRMFLITAASAVGVAGLAAWRPSLASAAGAGGGSPGTVTIVQFSDAGKPMGKVTVPRVVRPDAEWKQKLAPVSFEVTGMRARSAHSPAAPGTTMTAVFIAAYVGDNAVFVLETKFESGTGWLSFLQPIAKRTSSEIRDMGLGMERTAISCRECDAHLGHVFDDGPRPTGLRHCMNSAAMRFVKTA